MAILPVGTGRRVFVGTDVGVFATDDNATTWYRYQTGLLSVPVTDLIFDGQNRVIAAT